MAHYTVKQLMDMKAKGILPKPRKSSRNLEHSLQRSEVSYMRAKHRDLLGVFFAVPNGQKRTDSQTSWLHEEGMLNGVSDMLLLKPNRFYGCLCIENKTKDGRQREDQKRFQQAVESHGNKYVICRSLDDFIREIEDYLSND